MSQDNIIVHADFFSIKNSGKCKKTEKAYDKAYARVLAQARLNVSIPKYIWMYRVDGVLKTLEDKKKLSYLDRLSDKAYELDGNQINHVIQYEIRDYFYNIRGGFDNINDLEEFINDLGDAFKRFWMFDTIGKAIGVDEKHEK